MNQRTEGGTVTDPEPRRELDGQLSMPIAVDDYNGRLDYSLTECAGTSVEGDAVRAAARPSPDSVVDLGDGWRALLFVQAGHVRLSLIPRFGMAAHLTLTPVVAHHLAATVAVLADTAELSEEET